MAVLRLKSLPNSIITKPGLFRGYTAFSTISFHQLKHPAPTGTSTRYLPRFLDPRIYWNSSKSNPKSKGLQEKKSWNPATFYIAIFLLIGSQAIQIIALRLNHDERMRRANVKVAVLREVVDRLQRGEDVDVEGMLGVGNEKDEKSWEEVLKEIEEEDAIWQAKARKKSSEVPVSEDNTSANSNSTGRLETELQQKTSQKAQKAQSARDYGFS